MAAAEPPLAEKDEAEGNRKRIKEGWDGGRDDIATDGTKVTNKNKTIWGTLD